MKDAPWAPVFNEKRFTMHSARLGGDDALFIDPVHIPVNYDYIYVDAMASELPIGNRSTATSTITSAGTTPIPPVADDRARRRRSSSSPVDASGGPASAGIDTVADVATLDFGKVNPVTGPVYVDGAEPGDAIKVTLLRASRPRAGAGRPTSRASACSPTSSRSRRCISGTTTRRRWRRRLYGPGGRVPLKPFCGTIGLAPAEPGLHSIVPPRRVGGNMDIRDIAAGTELYLPVEVAGGLFSVGDTHAAQGDGEVCGTAIESPMIAGR